MSSKQLGLTSEEVGCQVARGLVNRVGRSDAAEYRDIVVRNLFTVYNTLVVPAAITLFVLGEYKGGFAVSGMALANLVLGLGQELRAKRLLEKLALLTAATAHVLRDGKPTEIPAGDVVQEDVLLLRAGEPLVADGTVLEAAALEVDEALLTGESDPVPRKPGDQVLSGSFCVAGSGSYRADRVGKQSFIQKTSREARSYRHAPSPLQQSIDRLVRLLTAIAVVLCCLYVLLYLTTDRLRFEVLVQMIAATLTSLVPQGLVLMTTFSFLVGAVRLSALGALVQQLNAVESMASIDTLCMDKTGTLTTNHLRLQQIVPLLGLSKEIVRQKIQHFVSAMPDESNKSLAALRQALGTVSVVLIDHLPFKSQNRYSAVRLSLEGQSRMLVLGAFEGLKTLLHGEHLGATETAWQTLMSSGHRLLVIAEAESDDALPLAGSLEGYQLRPLALIALSDELRPEARGVLENLAHQGIAFKILSGDNPDTVRATVMPLARDTELGSLRSLVEDGVATGDDLEKATDDGDALIQQRSVFGRVSPWQKVQIVKSLQKANHHVAMLGDGVNDVLPIKNADLGIAMGSGSRASKTVAGLVLANDHFGLLPRTLDEGRVIIRNLRRIGKLLLTKNFNLLLLIISTVGIFSLPFPFLPQQVTLLNALINGIPVVLIAMGRDPAPSAVRSSFFKEVGTFALLSGTVAGMAGLVLLSLAVHVWKDGPEERQTMLLTLTIGLGLVNALRLLHEDQRRLQRSDLWFCLVVLASIPLYLLVLYLPATADFFQLVPLDITHWLRVGMVLVAGLVVLFGFDWFHARRMRRKV